LNLFLNLKTAHNILIYCLLSCSLLRHS